MHTSRHHPRNPTNARKNHDTPLLCHPSERQVGGRPLPTGAISLAGLPLYCRAEQMLQMTHGCSYTHCVWAMMMTGPKTHSPETRIRRSTGHLSSRSSRDRPIGVACFRRYRNRGLVADPWVSIPCPRDTPFR